MKWKTRAILIGLFLTILVSRIYFAAAWCPQPDEMDVYDTYTRTWGQAVMWGHPAFHVAVKLVKPLGLSPLWTVRVPSICFGLILLAGVFAAGVVVSVVFVSPETELEQAARIRLVHTLIKL